MNFSWMTLAAVVVVNALYVGFMYLLQVADKNLPLRHSIIPGTQQKFLYVQDFYSCTWGDLIAIPLVVNAFVWLTMHGFVRSWQWLIFAIIAVADGSGFLMMCLGDVHKPDQGFPEIGKVSWHGLSHLPYHGVGVAMSVLVIWHTINGNLRGPVMYVALLGGVLYLVTFAADVVSGNFDPLKRI